MVETVIPAPPSKARHLYQPAEEIAREVANILNASYYDDILIKRGSEQSKNLSATDKSQLEGTIYKTKNAKKEHDLLIVDDLFEIGAMLEECVKALRTDRNIKHIYVLTITKTRTTWRS